jgi:cyclophilin family peptidyl-prolyl cis-trans isomerase
MRRRSVSVVGVSVVALLGLRAGAQTVPADRVNVLAAEDRRASISRDLATLRAAARGFDPQTARMAVRALGRLERPDLVPDIAPALQHSLPEVRSEAANALAQAARGLASTTPPASRSRSAGTVVSSIQSLLISRLEEEEEASVRAAICQSLGRLPYRDVEDIGVAERALLDRLAAGKTVVDRMGVAKALETFVRVTRSVGPPSDAVIGALKALSVVAPAVTSAPTTASGQAGPKLPEADPLRDARVRRLALESLILLDAVDPDLVTLAAGDPDAQVRRLAMRAATETKRFGRNPGVFTRGLEDSSPMVRLEALRGIREHGGDQMCAVSLALLDDADAHVSLLALDQLSSCGAWREATTRLEHAISDESVAASTRGWHRAAHASVALALAAPDRAAERLDRVTASPIWQLRMYSARAATVLKDRGRLEQLARDPNDNVVEAAIEGLRAVAGHASDPVYVAALARPGYQAVRMAALALDGTPAPDLAIPALSAALQRLVAEGRDNSVDTRTALADTLTRLGAAPARPPHAAPGPAGPVNGADLRRLAAPRARITIAGVGTFDLALFTTEAPLTVLRFASLAESGYYNGLAFHRVVPNFVIQGGSPGANEYVGYPTHMRDEVGLWPHVRGAVGISTRGRDTGDAQIFIDLVDNPRLDHQYTVFAQVLNGMDVVDRILEGDVIERVEIIP